MKTGHSDVAHMPPKHLETTIDKLIHSLLIHRSKPDASRQISDVN